MPLKLCAAILMLAGLTACATREIPKIVDTSCTAFSRISYATPKAGQEHADDLGNKRDTPETVTEIEAHNARYRALCPANPTG